MSETVAAMRQTLARWDRAKKGFGDALDRVYQRALDLEAQEELLELIVHEPSDKSEWCWRQEQEADASNFVTSEGAQDAPTAHLAASPPPSALRARTRDAH